jgi:hypothetical protein
MAFAGFAEKARRFRLEWPNSQGGSGPKMQNELNNWENKKQK